MNSSTRNSQLITYSILLIAAVLFVYSAARSAMMCFTVDEAFTYQAYVKHSMFMPEEYNSLTANFHMLNTWLMIVCSKIFGIAEWSLRMPNVLGHVLYLFFTAKFVLRNRTDWTAVGIFVLLNAHPYFLDFFSVARGYGLSFGLLAGALWYLVQYTREEKKLPHLLASVLFAGLAMWASFVTLHAFLGVLFLLFFLTIITKQLTIKQKLVRTALVAVLFAVFSGIALPVIQKMQEAQAFYWGHGELWKGTLLGLGGLLSYTVNGDIHLHQTASEIWVAAVLLLASALLVFTLIKNRKVPLSRNEPAVLTALLVIGMTAIIAQHFVLGSPYPGGRTFLWMFVIFLWAVCSALQSISIPKELQRAALVAAVSVQLFFAVPDFNLRYAEEWQYCSDVKNAVELLTENMRSGTEPNAAVTTASDAEFGNIAAYYLEQMNLRNIGIITCSGSEDVGADYYLITPHQQHIVPPADTVMVYRSSDLVLLRNQALSTFKREVQPAAAPATEVFTLDKPESVVLLLNDTFRETDTMRVRMNFDALISFPAQHTAGVFQFWMNRNNTNIWNSYAVCEPRKDSLAAVYGMGRILPLPFAPGDVFQIYFVPYKDPGGTIEISRFHAVWQVDE